MDSVLNCLVTDSIGPGEFSERFHKASREALGFDYGFSLRSPYIALSLALEALGVKAGDAIAVPALAPAYYARVAEEKGLSLVFIDSSESGLSPDLASIEAAIAASEKKPVALVLFEPLGIIPDPELVAGLGLRVIEDISQGVGAYRGETKAGSIGEIGILGLESRGIVTAGGGALLFARARRDGIVLRNLAEGVSPELKMTDYNAALGVAQLKELESNLAKRRELYQVFSQSLARTKHRLIGAEGEGEPGFWAFPVALESGMKDVRAYAKKKEIETEPAFEESLVGSGLVPEGLCPRARSLVLRSLLFPLHERIGASGAQKLSRVLATLP